MVETNTPPPPVFVQPVNALFGGWLLWLDAGLVAHLAFSLAPECPAKDAYPRAQTRTRLHLVDAILIVVFFLR